jgi:hypothetical protein
MSLPIFKIRCSQIGRIMSEPRSKADKEAGKLSETTKSYVHEWLTEQIYGVRKTISSKYIDKGNQMEDDAIDLLALHHGEFYQKNEQYFNNDFITGTPDIITESEILDTKCVWDCFTFPLFDTELSNKDYYWQMQGYMELCGKQAARVCYMLMNTPIELAFSELDQKDYTELPLTKRIKEFDVFYDGDDQNKIEQRVIQIRNYIEGL